VEIDVYIIARKGRVDRIRHFTNLTATCCGGENFAFGVDVEANMLIGT
jgi:hypothetical protein